MHRTPLSPTSSFVNDGLAGIDVHHATEQRIAAANEARTSDEATASGAGPIRHRAGSIVIAFGELIAGCKVARLDDVRFG